jgi:hypothetical protein
VVVVLFGLFLELAAVVERPREPAAMSAFGGEASMGLVEPYLASAYLTPSAMSKLISRLKNARNTGS